MDILDCTEASGNFSGSSKGVALMDILDCTEAAPASRPDIMIDEAVYLRFESWCKYRWGERDIVWIVKGSGRFTPPLKPAVLTKSERWLGGVWTVETPPAGPLGIEYPAGLWRLTFTVGSNTLRSDAYEAMQRYIKYLQDVEGEGGIQSLRDGDYSVQRNPNAIARALTYSGAADLLRTYR